MRHIGLLSAAALLAGCASAGAAPNPQGSCSAAPAQFAVGRAYDDALGERAKTASGARVLRVIPHDGVVTMDYSGDRLNLRLDPARRVIDATCG